MQQLLTKSQEPLAQCVHCGSYFADNPNESFCCRGCQVVYQAITTLGLGRYYELRGENRPSTPATAREDVAYRYADDTKFIDKFCIKLEDGRRQLTVLLEGIHCAACVWLLERLPLLVDGVEEARVRFADGQLDLVLGHECKLSNLLGEIGRLGYTPQPLEQNDNRATETRRSERSHLLRMGVAAVCAMNTMMFAISLYQGEYSGIDASYRNLLQWSSLALTLPVVFFSAVPFYRTALGGLRAGVLHIDLPIVIALLAAFVVSSWNTLLARSGVYFDSITAVVFLLLAARYLQKRVVGKIAGHNALLSALLPLQSAKVAQDGSVAPIYTGSVQIGDTLRFMAGERISVDGSVGQGKGFLNCAFLTGESKPQPFSIGTKVFAGTTVNIGSVDISVEACGSGTRIGKLLGEVSRGSLARPEIELFLDKRSRGFTAFVVMAALATFLFWAQQDLKIALDRGIAILLVSCPCVLALATPIVFSLGLTDAARKGILFKGAEVIERINSIKQVVFDKTGTLTEGRMVVQEVYLMTSDQVVSLKEDEFLQHRSQFEQLYQIEQGLEHPVARALTEFAKPFLSSGDLDAAIDIHIVEGKGVWAKKSGADQILIGSPEWGFIKPKISNQGWEIVNAAASAGSSVVVLNSDSGHRFIFVISDAIRKESRRIVDGFLQRGVSCSILSGDLSETTRAVGGKLGFAAEDCLAPLTPEEKSAEIRRRSNLMPTAMIGDGVNDIGALASASVGIGIIGGAEACLKVADVYLSEGGISRLNELFLGSARVMRSVRIGLLISVSYNLIGVIGAFVGLIGPLEAAVLMPLSSATSILVASTRKSF